MKLKGAIGIRGKFYIRHIRNGKVLSEEVITNTVTNTGKGSAAGLLGGLKTTPFTYLGIGTSATQALASDTDLKAGITSGSLARASATVSQVSTDVSNDTLQLLHTFTATASYTIKEAGVFDTASGGVMLARSTFADRALEPNDTLKITYQIDVD